MFLQTLRFRKFVLGFLVENKTENEKKVSTKSEQLKFQNLLTTLKLKIQKKIIWQ